MYKTQVFVNSEGDHNRTRLSHSLEVQQVARSVGSALGLNEPLCEALALAHDIGHPPFGHRGEKALDELMKAHGGFRHNAQVLRVVDLLERRSPDYSGLNLTSEVRQSLLKHESDEDWPEEFRPRPRQPWLEAQVVDLADSTAYNVHDVEDGLLAGMFSEEQLAEEVPLWRRSVECVSEFYPGFINGEEDNKLRIKRLTTQLLKLCIVDLIDASIESIRAAGLVDPHAARQLDTFRIRHSAEMKQAVGELQSFLWRRFYRHEHLDRLSEHALQVLSALFERHCAHPERMPDWYQEWAGEIGLERAVCDYLAGMTDRFAEHLYEQA
jgi:dGTPase